MKKQYSEKLNLDYKIKFNSIGERIIVFSDNVNYNNYEMSKLHGLSNNTLQKIHSIKKIFQGVIV